MFTFLGYTTPFGTDIQVEVIVSGKRPYNDPDEAYQVEDVEVVNVYLGSTTPNDKHSAGSFDPEKPESKPIFVSQKNREKLSEGLKQAYEMQLFYDLNDYMERKW